MTILEISFPKSGTHLLWQILHGFSPYNPQPAEPHFFSIFESDGAKHTQEDAMQWLSQLAPDEVAASHLYAWDTVLELVRNPPFVSYFIYRDLRDVCVSYVFHILNVDITHYHHEYYKSLPDFDTQLMTSILDVPGGDESVSDIGKRFRPYLGWMDCPEVLKVRFTDLIHDQQTTISQIVSHYKKYSTVLCTTFNAQIRPELSPTYRNGESGGWKKYFTEKHKEVFKEVAGDLLIQLGYEANNDW